jgi:hypothetical protein
MIETNDVELCTKAFGDPDDPPILLVSGMGAWMIWWEDDFCRLLADGGRFAIRYDHRDTGRSVTYEPGRPGYTFTDLVRDAADRRRLPESNRCKRLCRPLRNHSAKAPCPPSVARPGAPPAGQTAPEIGCPKCRRSS